MDAAGAVFGLRCNRGRIDVTGGDFRRKGGNLIHLVPIPRWCGGGRLNKAYAPNIGHTVRDPQQKSQYINLLSIRVHCRLPLCSSGKFPFGFRDRSAAATIRNHFLAREAAVLRRPPGSGFRFLPAWSHLPLSLRSRTHPKGAGSVGGMGG